MFKIVMMTLTCFFGLIFSQAHAQGSLTIVAVGEASLEKDHILIPDPNVSSSALKGDAQTFVEVIRNDFSFYKSKFYVDNKGVSGSTTWSSWEEKKISYVIQVEDSSGQLKIEALKVSDKSTLFTKELSPNSSRLRSQAHDVADEIYRAVTGKASIFKSKILFVSDRDGRGGESVKELYIMDFDGHNKTRLTNHGGTVISPGISHDGETVLYSLIKSGKKKRNVDLYVMDVKTRQTKLLSSRAGINSGAVFMPDGDHVALTLSHKGSANLYVMNIESGSLRQLTKSYAPDVDPSINRDASLMTFLSGRSGAAMIYTMDPSGLEKEVKRISYVGKFNATPRFSPDGQEIAFSSWLDNRFDIFRIGADGHNLSRLTKDFGSNEDPTYSPDGQFIAFSSQRVISESEADQNIYIMDRDGDILGPITKNYGNCITPRWSKH